MNLFLIKFHDIDNEPAVYEALHQLAGGNSFVPFDSHTFVLRTEEDFTAVKKKFAFDVDNAYNFMAIDITRNDPNDFFLDNNLEMKHMRDFIRDAQEYLDDVGDENWQAAVDVLLDKMSKRGIGGMSEEDMRLLRKYSQKD